MANQTTEMGFRQPQENSTSEKGPMRNAKHIAKEKAEN
jgi:hypothetical protein